MPTLLDTNILIYALQDKSQAAKELIIDENAHISVLSRMELFAGAQPNSHKPIKFLLNHLFNIEIDEMVSDKAGELIQKYSRLKRRPADALIAASAICYNLTLVTANTKDFKNISELKLSPFQI